MNNINIKKEKPPQWIWDELHRAFEIDDENTIYTYGNAIYDPRPNGKPLARAVIAHETVHMKQQEALEVDKWWNMYLTSPEFRKLQEIEAYLKQYAVYCLQDRDRNNQARYLNLLATFASSPMYKMNLSYSEALKLIKNVR